MPIHAAKFVLLLLPVASALRPGVALLSPRAAVRAASPAMLAPVELQPLMQSTVALALESEAGATLAFGDLSAGAQLATLSVFAAVAFVVSIFELFGGLVPPL